MSERFHRPWSSSFALSLAISLVGCATVGDVSPLTPVPVSAPEGAVAPAGLSEIRKGMSQNEVLRLLRPHHRVQHAADATLEAPLVDQFVYVEDGVEKYAEIFYEADRVLDVRYGFVEPFVFSHE